jgi:DME family drug/metabolite transporter
MLPSYHVLALASAVCTAAATIFIRQGLRGSDPYAGTWINVVVGTVGLWLAVLLVEDPGRPSPQAIAFFVLAGLIGTVSGRLLRFVSIEKVGASISAALINLSPLVSAILAIALLGEPITGPTAVGTLVIVAGAVLLSAGGRQIGYRPWHLTLPVLSAVCFGVVAILRKLGLGGAGAVMGSAINVTAALIAFAALLLASGRRDAMTCRGRSLAYFVAAGVAENAGVFMNVVALGTGMVSVVAPLNATSPVFTLLLSFFFLRGVEALTRRIVAGTLLIVAGVYLITALSGR